MSEPENVKNHVWQSAQDATLHELTSGGDWTSDGETPNRTVFLKETENWRQILANDLAQNYPKLDLATMNFMVQQTIELLIFLRMAEERGIEPKGQLCNLAQKSEIYKYLEYIYRTIDNKYNINFLRDSYTSTSTNVTKTRTPNLHFSDLALSEILKRFYPPVSTYRFDVFPLEILGNVYERFQENTLQFKSGIEVNVAKTPEIKKAKGAFYTPIYIVNHIVQNTVQKLCAGKTPQEVSRLKILDPACGGGIFLLVSYKFLLSWHLNYYLAERNQTGKIPHSPPASNSLKENYEPNAIRKTVDGEWKLTISERKRILLNNIFGVDLDAQAVEVTKLSLSLCALSGLQNEITEKISKRTNDLNEYALLNLSQNIRCGNSLIESDFFKAEASPSDSSEGKTPSSTQNEKTPTSVRVFNWDDPISGFGEITRTGGFDAIIGNPPYIFSRQKRFSAKEKKYFRQKFHLSQCQQNTYILFLELGFRLMKPSGILGFILPTNWMTIDSASAFRSFLLLNGKNIILINIIDQIFIHAKVDTSILIVSFSGESILSAFLFENQKSVFIGNIKPSHFLKSCGNSINFEFLNNERTIKLCEKLERMSLPLNEVTFCKVGAKIYQVGKGHPKQTAEQKSARCFHSNCQLDSSFCPYINGRDVKRYFLDWNGTFIHYGIHLAEPRKISLFQGERILVRQIPSQGPYSIQAVITNSLIINDLNSMIVRKKENSYSIFYILAILNSRLISLWFRVTFGKMQRMIFPQFKIRELSRFPVRKIDFSIPAEARLHDELAQNAELLVSQNRRLFEEPLTLEERQLLQSQIKKLDRQTDHLVYTLYALTDEEIRLCESP